jgi:hypothetical protein
MLLLMDVVDRFSMFFKEYWNHGMWTALPVDICGPSLRSGEKPHELHLGGSEQTW